MAKDYAKFIPPKRKAKKKSPGVGIVLILCLVFLAAAGFFYEKKSTSWHSLANDSRVTAILAKVTALLSHHKKEGSQSLKPTVKALALLHPEPPPPVRFDFYDELQTQKVSLPVADNNVAPTASAKVPGPVAPVSHPLVQAKSKPTLPAVSITPVAESKPKPPVAPVAISQPKTNIIDPEEVSTLLAAEAHASTYFIQLGAFETEQAAHRLQTALIDAGCRAEVVKLAHGNHKTYQLQQGPFATAQLAKLAQQRLQKRGITSVVRSID